MQNFTDIESLKAKRILILGIGKTGASMVRFCISKNLKFEIADSGDNPSELNYVRENFPETKIYWGPFSRLNLEGLDIIFKSPGIPSDDPIFSRCRKSSICLITEMDLFLAEIHSPLVAITGSNGKSTVTSLVGNIAEVEGLKVAVGGNLGSPMLDLIDDHIDLYVIELSSYQLENVGNMKGGVVCILNITPDHLDRHKTMQNYIEAKIRICNGASHVLLNTNDEITSKLKVTAKKSFFGTSSPESGNVGLVVKNSKPYIYFGNQQLMPVDHISIYGPHNLSNVLAACGLASIIGLSSKSIREAISVFKGLPHRCEKFLTIKNIDFINDSKSTNIDSTRVAIEAFRSDQTKNIILLMGGIDKNQNFSILNSIIGSAVKKLVLFGKHAERIKKMIDRSLPSEIFDFLEEATTYAYQIADSGDKILFSPGCSSFDEFANFEERGSYFKKLILRHGSKYEK